jgi:hypothetical protein
MPLKIKHVTDNIKKLDNVCTIINVFTCTITKFEIIIGHLKHAMNDFLTIETCDVASNCPWGTYFFLFYLLILLSCIQLTLLNPHQQNPC